MKRKIKIGKLIFLVFCIFFVLVLVFTGAHIFFQNKTETVEETKVQSYYDLSKFQLKNGLMSYKDKKYTSLTGVDVSDHNGSIDWSAVKQDGISFAMIRVGYRGAQEGILHEDANFDTNLEQAKNNGLDVGVYFFSSAINNAEIDEEVNVVLNKLSSYSINMPVVFDMEEFDQGGRIDSLTKQERTKLALRFCKKIKQAGYTPMIYGNMTWLYKWYDFDKISKYSIWMASYSKHCPMLDQFDIWQYSNTGVVNGIDGSVDLDLYLKRK